MGARQGSTFPAGQAVGVSALVVSTRPDMVARGDLECVELEMRELSTSYGLPV